MRNKVIAARFDNALNYLWQYHTHLIKRIFLSRHKSVKLVKAYSADKAVSHSLTVNRSFPFDILGLLCNSFDEETGAIIIHQKLILHLDKSFS